MKCIKSKVVYRGKLIDRVFDNCILAGQWAFEQGYNPDEYITVLLLENGEINHRAIIQVYDYQKGDCILENHYTTCGTFHLLMERYESDKVYLTAMYSDTNRYKVSCWKEY